VRRGSSLEQEVEHHVAERAYKDDSAGYPIKLRQSRLGQSPEFNLYLLSSELTNYICRSLTGILLFCVIVNPVKDLNVSQFLMEVCQGSPLGHIGLFYLFYCCMSVLSAGGKGVRPEPGEQIHYTQRLGYQVKSCVDCSGLDTDFRAVADRLRAPKTKYPAPVLVMRACP
jgi:hypothetical protein